MKGEGTREKELGRKNPGGGIMGEVESWRRIMKEESRRRNQGRGAMEEEPWRRTHGGGIVEKEAWVNQPGGIME
jgi:hypothetical protein